jgi:hypothetical protein
MEDSILKTIKQLSGVDPEDDSFDVDQITYINGVFVDLDDLGIGPAGGFMIEDETETWTEFFAGDGTLTPVFLNNVKVYVALRVRLRFDPPATSYHTTAMKEQIDELAWRIKERRERELWVG